MDRGFFNYRGRVAESWLDRLAFTRGWWRLYARDPRWSPPGYTELRRTLEPAINPHLARLDPLFLWVEAQPGRPIARRAGIKLGPGWDPSATGAFEQIVSAALLLTDRRRPDRAAYLALLHCANDAESLAILLEMAADLAGAAGSTRLLAPTGLSPFLGSGLLQDGWDRLPPQHAAYDPPYLAELAGALLEPLSTCRLFYLPGDGDLPGGEAATREEAPLEIRPVEPSRLAGDLLPLFSACLSTSAGFPPPDEHEARFLLRWTGAWPIQVWIAWAGKTPAGFILLGPDLAPPLRRANGGRGLLRRLQLSWAARWPAKSGCLFLGGVHPAWRGRGVGHGLLRHARAIAHRAGWERLAIGPVTADSDAAQLFTELGAQPASSYRLYQKRL